MGKIPNAVEVFRTATRRLCFGDAVAICSNRSSRPAVRVLHCHQEQPPSRDGLIPCSSTCCRTLLARFSDSTGFCCLLLCKPPAVSLTIALKNPFGAWLDIPFTKACSENLPSLRLVKPWPSDCSTDGSNAKMSSHSISSLTPDILPSAVVCCRSSHQHRHVVVDRHLLSRYRTSTISPSTVRWLSAQNVVSCRSNEILL